MITGAAKVAGVVGWPVKHSLSPLIHNAWIEALGLDAVYVPFAVPPDEFTGFIEAHCGGSLVGLNVTLPHKTAAYEVAQTRTEAIEQTGSANLLLFRDRVGRRREIHAQSTDGEGLEVAIRSAAPKIEYMESAIVVLGAGGVAAAAIDHLELYGGEDIRIVARRKGAAQALRHGLRRSSVCRRAFAFNELEAALDGADLVINATSAGLNGVGELPAMDAASPEAVFMDMVYSPLRTKFLRDAAARGHPTVDGLAMLIGQARPSFEAFFGVPPPPPEVVDVRALCLNALGETD